MRIIYIFLIVFFLSVNYSSGAGFYKYSGEFLNLGIGSRILGMAGAGTAAAADVTAAYWNPAGLTDADDFQAEFMHGKQFISSVQNNYLGFSYELENETNIGLSILYLTVNDLKDSRNAYDFINDKVDYSQIKSFNTGDYSFLFSYARLYDTKISYGLNVKMMYRDYYSETGYGIGFDAGVKYRYNEVLHFGLMLRDFTSTMIAWSTGTKEFITPGIRFGTSYILKLPAWNLFIRPAVDFNILFENRRTDSQLHFYGISLDSFWGSEISYKDLFFLRTGLDDLGRINGGAGITIPKIRFDYSFTPYSSELGNIQRISIHLQLSHW